MSPRTADIGPLEMEVLGIVDGKPEAISVGEIQKHLKDSGKDLAYTTVMTVLVRLYNKGYLLRQREGKQYRYSAAKSVSVFKHTLLDRLRQSLFQQEKVRPILALLEEDDGLSVDDLKELRGLIESKIKKAEKKR